VDALRLLELDAAPLALLEGLHRLGVLSELQGALAEPLVRLLDGCSELARACGLLEDVRAYLVGADHSLHESEQLGRLLLHERERV
jgi:hypothetical protein